MLGLVWLGGVWVAVGPMKPHIVFSLPGIVKRLLYRATASLDDSNLPRRSMYSDMIYFGLKVLSIWVLCGVSI